MNLFTKVDIPASNTQIDYKSRLAFFGSCFADNISAQFASRKFHVLANPFGTVYNPLSMAKQIKAIADGKVFGEDDVFQDMRFQNGADIENSTAPWHCWDAHSSLSAATREECIAKQNAAAKQARDFLQQADVVFITLGTSFVYFLKSLRGTTGENACENKYGTVVANCHRQDPRLFERRMISVEEAANAIQEIVDGLHKIKRDGILRLQASPSAQDDKSRISDAKENLSRTNEQDDKRSESLKNSQTQGSCKNRGLHIIFTVSPLRHMSDGAHNNTLSKATLHLAIEKSIQELASPVEHFPSYEIVMDELRDYRFFDSDMIHLSKIAEKYIFERMVETYCNKKTHEDIKQVEKFLKSANHRIQDVNSPVTAVFLQKLHAEAAKLEKQIAGLELKL